MRHFLVTLLSLPALALVHTPVLAQEVPGAANKRESANVGKKRAPPAVARASARVLTAATVRVGQTLKRARLPGRVQINPRIDGRSLIEFE